jgi:hypothetical protein
LAAALNAAARSPEFFTTVIFENSADVTLGEEASLRWPGPPPDGDLADVTANTNVSMTWYLTHSERRALETAIPPDPLPSDEFAAPEKRLARIGDLADRALKAQTAPLRDYLVKQLERARHYERIQAMKKWWQTDHAKRP